MEERLVKTFYRACKTNPPTDKDYVTMVERKGTPPAELPQELRESWYAYSAYDSIEGVREQALQVPAIGRHIFRYDIPEGAGIEWKQTLFPGHYDLWGDKETLQSFLTGYVCDVKDVGVQDAEESP